MTPDRILAAMVEWFEAQKPEYFHGPNMLVNDDGEYDPSLGLRWTIDGSYNLRALAEHIARSTGND